MKTFIFCLLMLSNSLVSNSPLPVSKPGGISVLTVDAAASTVGWKAEKTTGSHKGTVKVQSGSLTMYCGQLAKGWVLIDMNSLLVTDLDAPDKQKLEHNLKGDNFFDTDKFPQARLDITSVNNKSQQTYHFITVTGNLMLHGISKTVTFTADVNKTSRTAFAGQADIVINRRDWGIATKNIKYDTFINKDIHLHVQLQANATDQQVSSL